MSAQRRSRGVCASEIDEIVAIFIPSNIPDGTRLTRISTYRGTHSTNGTFEIPDGRSFMVSVGDDGELLCP